MLIRTLPFKQIGSTYHLLRPVALVGSISKVSHTQHLLPLQRKKSTWGFNYVSNDDEDIDKDNKTTTNKNNNNNMPHKKKASAASSSAQESQTSATLVPATMRQVSKTLHDGHPLPQLFVFDLDYTLWPFWVDTHCSGGLKYVKTNCVSDRHGEHFSFYSEVPDLLQELRAKGIKIAAASRTQTPDLAREMLKLLLIETPSPSPSASSVYNSSSSSSSNTAATADSSKPTTKKAIDFFDELQIFPANKVNHFNNLQQKTKIEYSEMIFFDDESRNRNVEKELGVVFVWVRDGVNGKAFDKGVEAWRKRWGKSHPLDGQQRRGGGGEDEL